MIEIKKIFFLFTLILTFAACAKAPVTGRAQLMLVPDSTMLSMSFSQYDEFLKSNKLSNDIEKTEMVKRVGNGIKNSVELYYQEIGKTSNLSGFRWEFNLIEDEQINAWCMPGGKIVVYTGLFKIASTEEDLAVVIGHEIAHAVAKHGNERMSQVLLTNFGGILLSEALSSKPEETKNFWLAVYGVGSGLGYVLPYSRLHEYEADYLGMVFMAKAGYHPYYAVRFWDKMERYANVGNKTNYPEFLSTHPTSSNRIKYLKEKHSEVISKYYKEDF